MHKVLITYYGATGSRESAYSPAIAFYEVGPDTLTESGTMTYNSTLGAYEYDFALFDPLKEYTAKVDFGTLAPMRYASYLISESAGALSVDQATALANTVKRGDIILNADDISIPLAP